MKKTLLIGACLTAAVLCSIHAAATAPYLPTATHVTGRELKVCADPNNLPFSNDRLEGFENEIARLVARELGREPKFVWWAQRRGYVRNTLKAGLCDVLIGVPSSFDLAETTRPYYRSSYVFVSQASRKLHLGSLDDPRLKRLRLGVQMIGDDFANSPPAHALASRGMVSNITGYSVIGDYRRPNPPAGIVDAVAAGDVDAAVVWGPLAGYFAAKEPVALELKPVTPEIDLPFLPFVFDISMGVRRGDKALHAALDEVIERKAPEIDAILDRFGVPRVGGGL